MISPGSLVADETASPEICALYSGIRASRGTDLISNFWRALAQDPPTLRRMWDSFTETMAPGKIDALTKELIFLAVSATNGCAYCTALHGSVAKRLIGAPGRPKGVPFFCQAGCTQEAVSDDFFQAH